MRPLFDLVVGDDLAAFGAYCVHGHRLRSFCPNCQREVDAALARFRERVAGGELDPRGYTLRKGRRV